MLPKPRTSLAANSVEFQNLPLVKPTGFREYDARWWFGAATSTKEPEINLLGVQALGLGLGTLIRDMGVAPRIVIRSTLHSTNSAAAGNRTCARVAYGARCIRIAFHSAACTRERRRRRLWTRAARRHVVGHRGSLPSGRRHHQSDDGRDVSIEP